MLDGDTPEKRLRSFLRESIFGAVRTIIVLVIGVWPVLGAVYLQPDWNVTVPIFALVGLGIGVSQHALWRDDGGTPDVGRVVGLLISAVATVYYYAIILIATGFGVAVGGSGGVVVATMIPILDIELADHGIPVSLALIGGYIAAGIVRTAALTDRLTPEQIDLTGVADRLPRVVLHSLRTNRVRR